MKTLGLITLISLLVFSAIAQTNEKNTFPVLKGDYFGQPLPGDTPELFAPGIISNGLANRDVAISPDGNEMYFGLHSAAFRYSTILFANQVNGTWTEPEVLPFASDPRYVYLEPALSYDGQKNVLLIQ
jgi:hypothetical protein